MIRICKKCGAGIHVPASTDQILRWQQGELIQVAMPHLTADQREILISGICGPCYDDIFTNFDNECEKEE